MQSLEENGPKKEGLGCYHQSARPLCLHGLIPLDLGRVELFKQMAKIIRVAGVSARCSVSSMLPDMTHVTSSSQHDAGGGRHCLPRSGFMASPVELLNFSKLTMRWGDGCGWWICPANRVSAAPRGVPGSLLLLLGMKTMGMKTHGLDSGFGIYFFSFSSGPWQMSVTHTELWIPQGASSAGFVFRSIQQALGAAAIKTLPKPLIF